MNTTMNTSMNTSRNSYTSNLVVLCGQVTSRPITRELPGGALVVSFDVTTRDTGTRPGGASRPAVSVPVAWHDPAGASLRVIDDASQSGAVVVVVGTVRRRFFRSGGLTQSRTEVVADRVVPATRRKTVHSLLAAAAAALTDHQVTS